MGVQWRMRFCYEKKYLTSTDPDCSWQKKKKKAPTVAKLNFWIFSSHIIHVWVVASPLLSKALVLALMQRQLFLHRSGRLLLQHAPGSGMGLAGVSGLVLAQIHSLIMFTVLLHACLCCLNALVELRCVLLHCWLGRWADTRPVPGVLLPYQWFSCVTLCNEAYWGWQSELSCGIQDMLFLFLGHF